MIPIGQQGVIPQLLTDLERNFPEVYVDIEMNSLEDAYVNIAKAEEKLHNERNNIIIDDNENIVEES